MALPSPSTSSPATASRRARRRARRAAKPTRAERPARRAAAARAPPAARSGHPDSRPTNMPPTIDATAADAPPADMPAWVRSTSAAHSDRHTSTEPVRPMSAQASQYGRAAGRRHGDGPRRAARRRPRHRGAPQDPAGDEAEPGGPVPGRRPRSPRAPRPAGHREQGRSPAQAGADGDADDQRRDQAHAGRDRVGLADRGGEAGPWCSVSAVTMPLTTSVPNVDGQRPRRRWSPAAAGRGTARPPRPRRRRGPASSVPPRPNRRASSGNTAPPTSRPTARPVPCRLATATVVPCSSRSSGTTGPEPVEEVAPEPQLRVDQPGDPVTIKAGHQPEGTSLTVAPRPAEMSKLSGRCGRTARAGPDHRRRGEHAHDEQAPATPWRRRGRRRTAPASRRPPRRTGSSRRPPCSQPGAKVSGSRMPESSSIGWATVFISGASASSLRTMSATPYETRRGHQRDQGRAAGTPAAGRRVDTRSPNGSASSVMMHRLGRAATPRRAASGRAAARAG